MIYTRLFFRGKKSFVTKQLLSKDRKEVSAYAHERTVAAHKSLPVQPAERTLYENPTPNPKSTSAKSTERSFVETTNVPAFSLRRRIGQTYYTVNVRFSEQATQTMEEKLLHMIPNETVDFGENCGIIPHATNEPSV